MTAKIIFSCQLFAQNEKKTYFCNKKSQNILQMRHFLAFLLLIIASQTSAQLLVEGRLTMWDQLTNTFLATVPDTCFSRQVTLTVTPDERWSTCTIEGLTETDKLAIPELTAETKVAVCYEDSTGHKTEAILQFTFLPIVCLQGDFGYDYTSGMLLLSCPDSVKTDTLTANIKWRGATTNKPGKHKRNYTVKLPNDTTLLGLRNDNKWILDAGQPDVFRLRNRVAMDLWNDLARKPYYADRKPKARNGVSGKVVELFLNGEYRGIYNFSEDLDRKQMKLEKVKDGVIHGCLYKVKDYGYGNMNSKTEPYDNNAEIWENIEVKYPELNDNDTTDWSTLANAINFVVESSDRNFVSQAADYFDLPIVTDISIFISIVNGLDNRGKNIIWAVYDKEEDKKLTPAPWDLDCTVGQEWLSEDIRGPEILFDWQIGLTNRLIRYNVKHFNDSLNHRYKELRKDLLTTDSLIARYRHYYNLVKRSGAASREEARWSGDSDVRGMEINFDKEIDYITSWLTTHMEWLDGAWYPLDGWYEWYESQGIRDTEHPSLNNEHFVYDLQGRKTPNIPSSMLKKGIYIVNGKKIAVR